MQRCSCMTALWASPPALRSELLRRAFLTQDQHIFSSTPFRRSITATRGYHRTKDQFISLRRIQVIGKRWSSSATTQQPSSVESNPLSPQETSPQKSRAVRFLTTTALAFFLFAAGLTMSAAPAAETVNGYINPPTDAETLQLYHPITQSEEEINEYILRHPLSVKLRAEPGTAESRPHMRIPPAMRPHNLTGGTLAGEGKIEVPPLNFNTKDELPSMTQIMYLGPALCGHPGIVHGGLLATLLDEGLARACFPALPNKIGVTASLKIDYRNPCPAGSYVVLKAETTKVDGRKAWVKGWIELLGEKDAEGTKLVEAEALFIEPKGAKSMARNIVASDG